MKKSVRVFGIYALVPLLMAGFCAGSVWRGKRQHENDKALFAAIDANDAPAVIAALKRGANPNVRAMPEDKRSLKHRFLDLLHPAAQSDCPTGHRAEDYNTQIYLLVLMDSDNVDLVKALLDAGADPNAKMFWPCSREQRNASLVALEEAQHNYPMAHLLPDYHADIHAQNNEGETPLIVAAREGNCAEIGYLLQYGADIEEEGRYGDSALTSAVRNQDVLAAKYLRAMARM